MNEGPSLLVPSRMLVFDELIRTGKLSPEASVISDAVGRIEKGRSVVRTTTLPELEPVRAFPRFDTSVAKTDFAAPDPRKDLERIARRRYENPKPFKEGAFWWLLCWQDELSTGYAHESASA